MLQARRAIGAALLVIGLAVALLPRSGAEKHAWAKRNRPPDGHGSRQMKTDRESVDLPLQRLGRSGMARMSGLLMTLSLVALLLAWSVPSLAQATSLPDEAPTPNTEATLLYSHPDHNTFGYTTTFDDPAPGSPISNNGTPLDHVPLKDRPVWDAGGGSPASSGELRVDVELGGFNRMHSVTDIDDYWMDVDFTATVFMWANGDGNYCPNLSLLCPGIAGDDPCPTGDFPLFDVLVLPGGSSAPPTFLRTVMGGNMRNCVVGALAEPSENHPFDVLAAGDPNYPSDGPNRFRIPKELIDHYRDSGKVVQVPCYATIIFRPHDLILPAYAAAHNKSQDGIKLEVRSVMIQLVAPPMVISHGWTTAFSPTDPPPVSWQYDLRADLTDIYRQYFGQDPWEWARANGREPVLLNVYGRKQDFRTSAHELSVAVTSLMNDMHWTGKVWMHGHSLGGLVSRYYIEDLDGANHVEKFSQDASPNTGTWVARVYTWLHRIRYAEQDGETLGRYILGNSKVTTPSISNWLSWIGIGPLRCWFHLGWYFWKPWYEADIGAYAQGCDSTFQLSGNTPLASGSRMADFELTPASWGNPILRAMNDQFFSLAANPGSLPPYFAPPSTVNNSNGQLPTMLPPYFTVRASWAGLDFDEAVPFSSASLNGAIPNRTIVSEHEETADNPDTVLFLARYYGNLDLDDGYPHFCRPQAPPDPYPQGANPGDAVTLNGGSDYIEDRPGLRFEEYGARTPDCPFGVSGCVNEGDEQDPASTAGADRFDVVVDGQAYARFTVHSALEEPPLHFDALSPTGQPAPVATNDETGWTRVQTIQVTSPQAGQWTIHVGPAPGQAYYMELYWDSPLQLIAGTTLASYPAHTPVAFTAQLKGPSVSVAQANVFAEVTDPISGAVLHIPLQQTAGPPNENWSGTWAPPLTVGPAGELACEGGIRASVTATGNRGTNQVPTFFSRSVEIDIHIEGDPADAQLCNPDPGSGETGSATVLVAVPLVVGILLGGFGGGWFVGRRRRV